MQSIVVGGLLASWLIAEQLLLELARKSDVAGHTCGYELYFRLHCNKCPLHTVIQGSLLPVSSLHHHDNCVFVN